MIPANKTRFFFVLVLAIICGCQKENSTIKIGFVANLTGKHTAIALGARNGALMAVSEINKNGGIHGKKIELIVKDDRLDAQRAVEIDQELIDENVAAIVGHLNSAMSLAALPVINQAQVVMVSPVSASNKLAQLDDYLFRINPLSSNNSSSTARYALEHGLYRISVFYDLAARDYTEATYKEFKDIFEKAGGKIIKAIPFTSTKFLSYPELIKASAQAPPDAYFIIADPYNTAMICQHLKKEHVSGFILVSSWAYHPDFLKNGGKAVEDVIFSHTFEENSQATAFLRFKDEFISNYKAEPRMYETFGYEAVLVLSQALGENPDPKRLKQTLLKIRRFRGLQGDILFNRFGDNSQPSVVLSVKNGAFVKISEQKNIPN